MNRSVFACLALLVLLVASGCQLLGVAAAKAPPPTVPAAYDELTGKTAAVWVWVDPAVELDYPDLSLQLATQLQDRLETARDDGSGRQQEELAGLTFPIAPASIVRYQKNDPVVRQTPIRELAPRLEVDRVIYVEVVDFTTQGGAAGGLWRGEAAVNLFVLGVEDATATAVFEDPDIKVAFPPDAPEEGVGNLGAQRTYVGLVNQLAETLSLRFLSHPSED